MGWLAWILVGWAVLALLVLVLMAAVGRAAKRGDEDLERRLAARRASVTRWSWRWRGGERRHGDRRRSDGRDATRYTGPDRRRHDRRRSERRADPGRRDDPEPRFSRERA